jgi:hypothetical protein
VPLIVESRFNFMELLVQYKGGDGRNLLICFWTLGASFPPPQTFYVFTRTQEILTVKTDVFANFVPNEYLGNHFRHL